MPLFAAVRATSAGLPFTVTVTVPSAGAGDPLFTVTVAEYLNLDEADDLYLAASHVLAENVVHGDALTMRATDGQPISFAEWGYLGKGKYQRRDFRFDVLTGSSKFSEEGSLWADQGKHEIFTPIKTHPPMTMRELAAHALKP